MTLHGSARLVSKILTLLSFSPEKVGIQEDSAALPKKGVSPTRCIVAVEEKRYFNRVERRLAPGFRIKPFGYGTIKMNCMS